MSSLSTLAVASGHPAYKHPSFGKSHRQLVNVPVEKAARWAQRQGFVVSKTTDGFYRLSGKGLASPLFIKQNHSTLSNNVAKSLGKVVGFSLAQLKQAILGK